MSISERKSASFTLQSSAKEILAMGKLAAEVTYKQLLQQSLRLMPRKPRTAILYASLSTSVITGGVYEYITGFRHTSGIVSNLPLPDLFRSDSYVNSIQIVGPNWEPITYNGIQIEYDATGVPLSPAVEVPSEIKPSRIKASDFYRIPTNNHPPKYMKTIDN